MNSGIYKIINKINGHYYVGKSRNIKDRWSEHKRSLNRNTHDNAYLQCAWNKYGADAFEFVMVEYLEPNDSLLTEVEQTYLDKFLEDRKNGIHNCYNIAITSDSSIVSNETKEKLSESHKGEKNHMYGKTHSDETLKKISQSHKGKTLSEEHKKKISDSVKGEKHPQYGKTGVLSPSYGKIHSEETKKKISESMYGKPRSKETRKKLSELNKGEKNSFYGKTHSEESRKKMSEASKRYWAAKRAAKQTSSETSPFF